MKIINFLDLYKTNFVIHSLTSIHQTPSYRNFSTDNRQVNGFLLVDNGKGRYDWEGGSFELHPYSLIYLPLHSVHHLTVYTESISFYRINFIITDMADKNDILFSSLPVPISDNIGSLFVKNAKKLSDILTVPDGGYRAMSLFYDMLSELYQLLKHTSKNRIIPAIDYINNHYTEDVSAAELAELCLLSETHFYRLFKAETGQTPSDYRNSLRIQRACLLLRETDRSVSEISSELGFDSIYYFSRVFKKYIGKSPTKYTQNNNRRYVTNDK